MISRFSPGHFFLGSGRCSFCLWAPGVKRAELRIISPAERTIPLNKDNFGYHRAQADDVFPGNLYLYRLKGKKERPDPASRFQPKGVHGPSQVVEPEFPWEDQGWCGIPLSDYILYEIHVGTYTREGDFKSIIPHLDRLKDLGVTALELMPVAEFPGDRNWGYDGVYPFAVESSYGGPRGLKALVNACHRQGLAVVLDVVYNHLGPEGNYLPDFGPYFTNRYKTPWGLSVNLDGPYSDEVRNFFTGNALYWVREFHIDALRLDAVHAMFDFSARPFLKDLARRIHKEAERLNRRIYLFPESALNDSRIIRPPESGGFGLDAQWNDDFHHALHALLTGEKQGYYRDFGEFHQMVKAFREGYVYSGEYSPFRGRRQGNFSGDIPGEHFIVYCQNHDQVGNRRSGDRLSSIVCLERLKLAAACVILSPFIPLLFMGEEYGETAPFPFFASHSDESTIEDVRRGRKQEFSGFNWQGEPPDPQDEETFMKAKLDHGLRLVQPNKALYEFYRELIRIRRRVPLPESPEGEMREVTGFPEKKVMALRLRGKNEELTGIFHFGENPCSFSMSLPEGEWEKVLESTHKRWAGPGCTLPENLVSTGEAVLDLAPYSAACLVRKNE